RGVWGVGRGPPLNAPLCALRLDLDGTSSGSVPLDEGVSEYGHESMWRDTAIADADRARDLAARLERRATAEDEVSARETYLTLLDISAGERVLDVGCGSGAITRDIARRVGERGLAIGLDPSPELLAVARRLAEGTGLGDRVEFRVLLAEIGVDMARFSTAGHLLSCPRLEESAGKRLSTRTRAGAR